jgi:hypothetical protein
MPITRQVSDMKKTIVCGSHGPREYEGHLVCSCCQVFMMKATNGDEDIPEKCPKCDTPFSPQPGSDGTDFSARCICPGCAEQKANPN